MEHTLQVLSKLPAASSSTTYARINRPPRPSPYNDENVIPMLDLPAEQLLVEEPKYVILESHRDVHPAYSLPPFRIENPNTPCPANCDG